MDSQEQPQVDITGGPSQKNSFYVHVSSAAGVLNECGTVICQLPEPLVLQNKDNWECALVEIVHGNLEVGTQAPYEFGLEIIRWQNPEWSRGLTYKHYKLPAAHYRSPQDIVNSLNAAIASQEVPMRGVSGPFEENYFRFVYNPVTRKINCQRRRPWVVAANGDIHAIRLYMNNELRDFIKFPDPRTLEGVTAWEDTYGKGWYYLLCPRKLHSPQSTESITSCGRGEVNIMMDGLAPNYLRGDKAPILYRCDDSGISESDVIHRTIKRREYIELKSGQTLRTLSFRFEDSNRRLIRFDESHPTLMMLHFRKTK